MDTFKEQIIKIKGNVKTVMLQALIWVAALFLTTLVFMFLGQLGILIGFLFFYGAWHLSQRFSIEYEYILTNGDLDIDKIMAQRTRKRLCTIKCADIESMGKYAPGMPLGKDALICCNADDEAYFLRARDSKGNAVCIVIAPNDKMKAAIKTYVPRIIQRDAFAD